jgi:hypothetical protein
VLLDVLVEQVVDLHERGRLRLRELHAEAAVDQRVGVGVSRGTGSTARRSRSALSE